MRPPPRSIVITGFMGAGKTAVAMALAERLAAPFIDLDHFIAKREGRPAETIIDEDGEERFRAIETEALRDVLNSEERDVIALGGGTWTIAPNRDIIAQHNALTVWLDAPFELCWRRIANESRSRPLARELGSSRALYEERRPIYELADIRIEVTENGGIDSVVNATLMAAAQRR